MAAQGALKRRTSADRSVRPPRRLSAPPRRSAAFAVARARRLEAPSPSDRQRLDDAVLCAPQRDVVPDAELYQEAELDLAGDERRQLEQERVRARRPVEVEAGGLERLVPCLGEGRDGNRGVVLVQVPLGGQRDDDVRDVHAGGDPVRGIASSRAVVRGERDAVRRLQEGVHTLACLRVERAVRRLEPRARAAADRRGRWGARSRDVVRPRDRHDGTRRRRAARRNTGHGPRLIARSPGVISCRPLVHPVGHDPCTNP